ncbi:DEAD/DEAH box helicase [Rhodoferax sp.]|uniref:DEAD/DEAH box helicase n=1 Tax=Rhodoferax sp. TaxID=50421 RepID=UPI002777F5C9|nr:DEAD/DEAH box helicase [Rhodoferax sp.]
MTQPDLIERHAALPTAHKAILATLALVGSTPGQARLVNYLREARFKSPAGPAYTSTTLAPVLTELQSMGLLAQTVGDDIRCAPAIQALALKSAMAEGSFGPICHAVEVVDRVNFGQATSYPRNYRNAVMVLRMAMLRGRDVHDVSHCLSACGEHYVSQPLHPYLEICARPFDSQLFSLLQPMVQEAVLAVLLPDCLNQLGSTRSINDCAQRLMALPGVHNPTFVAAYAQHLLLSGQLGPVQALADSRDDAFGQALRSAVLLLKGDLDAATSGFESALKLLRKDSGRSTAVFSGLCGYLHVLALLRSADPKLKKRARGYIDQALRQPGGNASPFGFLNYLSEVQAGERQVGDDRARAEPRGPLATLFSHLVDYWLGVPTPESTHLTLAELCLKSDAAGFQFIAAQAAELLGRTQYPDSAVFAERARALRDQQGTVALADWFERQEPWQRQLALLAGLAPPSGATLVADSRLVWELQLMHGQVFVEPREQKRKGKAAWTSGRAVALRRLSDEAELMDFLTPQDLAVCAIIKPASRGYYGGTEYVLSGSNALPHLIGHPLVFWQTAPGVRVEILRGEPELEIKKTAADSLTLRLQPPINDACESVLISKETPTRLRVIEVTAEHRRIAAILGESLKVPARAKEQVLDAIRAISSLITIQSDIDVLPSNLAQVAADTRMHVHLMPHGPGLRISLLVRPFASAGPYYAPGAGSESVIAEIAGQPLQARRNLATETQAASALVAACPVLRDSVEAHGERVVDEPQDCLELLLQMQAQADKVLIAWPEGEKFRISREINDKRFSISIKRDLDWFAVGGELTIDDDTVIDLQKLLALTAAGRGRFIHLGDNQFLALTDEFRRRLDELRAYAQRHGKGLRVHALASGALQDLADAAGKLKSDKHWKDHLARLSTLDALEPVLPATLQADLRDYQLTGFNWLCRLAHWGVGACLADDMGLGKTLQALALLLSRAPQGPALVVAPTSVCLNWLAEIDRFAPTLKVIVFGSGDRQLALSELKPFDLVITSYGLLQSEVERFSAVRWHSIVLDEAQAIKNHQTKRSQAAMALQGDFRMLCSGTPLENHLGELWNLFRFINPGLLGSLEDFNERYAGPIERLQDGDARQRLRKLIRPFILRRTKSQVLSELPSRTEILRQVQLSSEESALYEALRRAALERLANTEGEGGQRHIQILAEIMKLRRACCNPQLVAPELGLPSSKLAAFGELLDELLANRHKALVFSQFVDHLSLIRRELDTRGVRYQYLDGSTPMRERQVRVDAFQGGDGDVFLISLKAGGTGLNLTAADYVIHMDPWWNPAVEDQASDRAHRIGQTRPVTIYRLVAKETIEEKIVDLHQHKRALADSLLEGSDLGAKMSADDMLQLLQDEWRSDLP